MSCAQGDFNCIINNCSGDIGSGTQLFNYWQENNCPAAYAQAINTSDTGLLQYNPENQAIIQQKVVQLFNTYFITNTITDDVTSTSYNTFQNTLLNLCVDPTLPGICTQFLNQYCSQFSRDQVNNSPILIDFCGCYTPPDETYLQYTLGSPQCNEGVSGCTSGCTAGNTGCTGQPACDPLCHRSLTSQKANNETGFIITCPQTICVIDNITINITESEVPGGINFNTVCPGCGGASGGDGCLCIVSGVNPSATMGQIGVGVNFNQFCSGNSVCIVEDSAGNIISEGGCSQITPSNIPLPYFSSIPNIGIILIIILVIIVVLFVAIAARFSTQKVDRPIILEETTPQNSSIQYSYQIK